MSTYNPQYGVTEAMETKAIKSRAMVRLNAEDIIKLAINRPETAVTDASFVEFADNGDLIFTATLIKPVEKK